MRTTLKRVEISLSLREMTRWDFTSSSGRLNSTLRSRRPGRTRAGSSVSGRFVAINTLIFPRGSNPSSWLINSNIVRCTSLSPPAPSSNRAPPMASTSSKKIMQAFFPRAISNNSRTIRAPCGELLVDTKIKRGRENKPRQRISEPIPNQSHE